MSHDGGVDRVDLSVGVVGIIETSIYTLLALYFLVFCSDFMTAVSEDPLIACADCSCTRLFKLKDGTRPERWGFFLLLGLSGALDLPRWAVLSTGQPYSSSDETDVRVSYGCHLFASVCFFAAFTCVIGGFKHAFSGLDLALLRPREILAVNLLFFGLAVGAWAVLFHDRSRDLDYFFESPYIRRESNAHPPRRARLAC
jgi:hypothetical protein